MPSRILRDLYQDRRVPWLCHPGWRLCLGEHRCCPRTLTLFRSTRSALTAPSTPLPVRLWRLRGGLPERPSMLLTSAKITHLAMLPGQPERMQVAKAMAAQNDAEGFGGCTNIGECPGVPERQPRWSPSASSTATRTVPRSSIDGKDD